MHPSSHAQATPATQRWFNALLCSMLALLVLSGCSGGAGGAAAASSITVASAPASQTVDDGRSASLGVVASSATPLTYQWLREGSTVAGATDAGYVTPALSMADDGVRYSVVLRDASGGTELRSATLTVKPIVPTLAEQPQAQSGAVGQQSTFAVRALGSQPLRYQWQRNGVDVPGAISASFTTADLTSADEGARYRVIVSNAAGEAASDEASQRVSGAGPVVLRMLQVGVVAAGQSIVISTTLVGTPPFSYQWLRNGEPVAGAAGTTDGPSVSLNTPPLSAADQGVRYAIVVTTAGGSARSSDAVIAVIGAPRVAAGGAHSLARSADGLTVWAWGDNGRGQLGLGAAASSGTPQVVAGLPAVKAIAAGAVHSLALASDGSVWAWGGNATGALGDGTQTDRRTPQRVAGLSGVVGIAAGAGRSFAWRADGSLWSWGENSSGALGLGTQNNTMVPTAAGAGVAGFAGIVAVAAGARHTLALRSDGTVFAMGEVAVPLPDGITTRSSPAPVPGLASVAGIAAGDGFSVALDISGRLWTWGNNGSGQLGLGSTAPSASPQAVTMTQAGAPLLPSLGLAAGADFALARPVTGATLAWGGGANGQLGSGGAYTAALSPTAMAALPLNLVSVAAGRGHALAVLADGSVYAWGANAAGQLGIGSSEARRTEPVQVPALNLN